jgi:hypothetical protein
MAASMKGSGRMICNMGKEGGHTLMVHSLILISVSEESMGRHNIFSQTEMLTIVYTIMVWKIDLIAVVQDAGTVLG